MAARVVTKRRNVMMLEGTLKTSVRKKFFFHPVAIAVGALQMTDLCLVVFIM